MMSTTLDPTSAKSVQAWLIRWLVTELQLAASDVVPSKPFLAYGMDSIQAMTLVGELEDACGVRFPPTLVWEYPNLESLAEHVSQTVLTARAQTMPLSAVAAPATSELTPNEAEALLARLESLSDDQVETLLQQHLRGIP